VGACLLLHLRCTYRDIVQIIGFTHNRLCGIDILHVAASPTLSLPRHICQPCLQDLLLTRKTMTSQFLSELMLRTRDLLQFTSGTCSATNDIIRLELYR
jgi:hypothetical protein